MRIRLATPGDLPFVVALGRLQDPTATVALQARMDAEDARRGNGLRRWVAEHSGGSVVAYAQHRALTYFPAAGRRHVHLVVAPAHRGCGLGRRLLDQVHQDVRRVGAAELLLIGDDTPAARALLASYQVAERQCQWELPAPWEPLPLEAPAGIHLASLDELQQTEADWFERLYALHAVIAHSLPSVLGTAQVLDRQRFREAELQDPGAWHRGFIVARAGEDWVGYSELRKTEPGGPLRQQLTGVLPEARGRGIATAMKILALTRARNELGHRGSVLTTTVEENTAMNTVNRRLGFRVRERTALWLRRLEPE